MTIEEKLKVMILERYGSMIEFSRSIDMPNATLQSIINRGIHKASVNNIIKICKALDISTDELAQDRIVPNKKEIKLKTSTDVEEMIKFIKMNVKTYSDLTLNGNTLTDNDREVIADALDLSLEFIKRRIKK